MASFDFQGLGLLKQKNNIFFVFISETLTSNIHANVNPAF